MPVFFENCHTRIWCICLKNYLELLWGWIWCFHIWFCSPDCFYIIHIGPEEMLEYLNEKELLLVHVFAWHDHMNETIYMYMFWLLIYGCHSDTCVIFGPDANEHVHMLITIRLFIRAVWPLHLVACLGQV